MLIGMLFHQDVSILIRILEDGPLGDVRYSEEHFVTTSKIGLVNLAIGGGFLYSGSFDDIDWETICILLKFQLT